MFTLINLKVGGGEKKIQRKPYVKNKNNIFVFL